MNTSRRKLEEILVKVAMRAFMQMTAKILLVMRTLSKFTATSVMKMTTRSILKMITTLIFLVMITTIRQAFALVNHGRGLSRVGRAFIP